MIVERLPDAGQFLAETEELRLTDPVRFNLLSTIASSVVGGREFEECFWWLVRDESGAVVGAALRTAPHNLMLSPMPEAAATALGRVVAATDPRLPGVNGPAALVGACYAGVLPSTPVRQGLREQVYRLGDYFRPSFPPGRVRDANAADTEFLVEWNEAFGRDAGVPGQDWRASVAYRLAYGGWLIWEDETGAPVAIAGFTEPVPLPTGSLHRVGPVYTPAALRGRGYATAVTASVVERLRGPGAQIMLLADVANPASNAVYRKLGFEVVAELLETFVEPAPG